MQRDELSAWLRLTLTPGLGPHSARKLLSAFGLPPAIWQQSNAALGQVLNKAQVQAVQTEPDTLAAVLDQTWAWLHEDQAREQNRRVAVLGDAHYPAGLLNLDDPPLMLYMIGQAGYVASDAACEALVLRSEASLAMVGSRNPTPQGLTNARQFAKAMVQAGLAVVSGLALGIDGAAHAGALEGLDGAPAAPATVAVVGTGLDRVYPKAHLALAHRIAERGLIISEYPLGTPPLTANFPKRNRLIAALARGTLVVEAALQSGSLISARLSMEQGKEVFAIPGSIHAAQSRGCHALIKQGAKLVESAQDILEELNWSLAMPSTSLAAEPGQGTERPREHALLEALGYDPVSMEVLAARTALSTAHLQASLMSLELEGLVARLPGGLYQRQAG